LTPPSSASEAPLYQTDLSQTPLPDLLVKIYRYKAPGRIECRRGDVIKRIYLDRGNIIFATTNQIAESLGDRLLNAGRITREQYDESLRRVRASGKRHGVTLVEMGLLAAGELFAELRGTKPVFWQDIPNQPGYWAVLKHKDVETVARHPRLYSASEGGVVLEDLTPERLEHMRGMLDALGYVEAQERAPVNIDTTDVVTASVLLSGPAGGYRLRAGSAMPPLRVILAGFLRLSPSTRDRRREGDLSRNPKPDLSKARVLRTVASAVVASAIYNLPAGAPHPSPCG